jgi:hypothetical protein
VAESRLAFRFAHRRVQTVHLLVVDAHDETALRADRVGVIVATRWRASGERGTGMVGPATMSIVTALTPRSVPSLTVHWTRADPALAKAWLATGPEAVPPSPKSH